MIRSIKNPLITKEHIKPSHPNLKVDGVFNCGATQHNGQFILLLRIAESAIPKDHTIDIPILDENNQITIQSIDKNDQNFILNDSRIIKDKTGKVRYLTSLSHFRRAYSDDGIHFIIDQSPWIFPNGTMESWGIEDPRITQIKDVYLITYTAVSKHGVSVGLIETSDFNTFKRHGLILPVDNKDVAILPEKVNDKYYMYHRPVPNDIGSPNMWSATSLDLTHWGEHKLLLTVNDEPWSSGRVGGGAPSIKTPNGWLHIYHAASKNSVYSLGAFLTSPVDPSTITHMTKEPILSPELSYEKTGFFPNVVFTCGVILKNDTLMIYYGAADDKICLATIKLNDILKKLKKVDKNETIY